MCHWNDSEILLVSWSDTYVWPETRQRGFLTWEAMWEVLFSCLLDTLLINAWFVGVLFYFFLSGQYNGWEADLDWGNSRRPEARACHSAIPVHSGLPSLFQWQFQLAKVIFLFSPKWHVGLLHLDKKASFNMMCLKQPFHRFEKVFWALSG